VDDRTDQLSLSLSGDVTRLPRSLRPMHARPADSAFDSDEHLFEPRWGGRRVLVLIEPEAGARAHLTILDEGGRDLAPLLPELRVVADRVADLPAVLDGELVIPDRAGRMDETALEGRLNDGLALESIPVLLVFDLLWSAGRPVLALPLVKRRERLAKVVTTGPELVVLPGVVGEGMDLYSAVSQQGLRGVMARHLRSPYLPGRVSDLWRWIAAEPGEMPLHLVPNPVAAPPSRPPMLALIQRLPLEYPD
jgi:ATP-dependent DNA ligase